MDQHRNKGKQRSYEKGTSKARQRMKICNWDRGYVAVCKPTADDAADDNASNGATAKLALVVRRRRCARIQSLPRLIGGEKRKKKKDEEGLKNNIFNLPCIRGHRRRNLRRRLRKRDHFGRRQTRRHSSRHEWEDDRVPCGEKACMPLRHA